MTEICNNKLVPLCYLITCDAHVMLMDAMRDYSLGTSLAEKYEILKFYFFLDRNAVSICSKKRHMSTRYDKDAQKNVRSWFWGNCNVLLYPEC